VLDALPSVKTPDDIFGVTAVAFVDDSLYVLTAAGGRDVGDPAYDNAILRAGPLGEVSQVVNVMALNYQSPPLARLRDVRADVEGGVPFGMTAAIRTEDDDRSSAAGVAARAVAAGH